MLSLTAWSRFMEQQVHGKPWQFTHGMRHEVTTGPACQFHSHPTIEIVYHPSGRGTTRIAKGRPFSFSEGSAVIYPPRELHDQTMDAPGEDLCVQIAIPKGMQGVPDQALHVAAFDNRSILEDLKALSRGPSAASPSERAILNFRATAVLWGLIQTERLDRESARLSGARRYASQAEYYIGEHFAEIVSLRQVADEVGIGYDHLRHVFKKTTGKGMSRHLNEVRIERAKALLLNSKLPLKQIATMCGFQDEYYFSTVFRQHANIPPGRYRDTRISRRAA
jgi:AraC-like DNA-binding protein